MGIEKKQKSDNYLSGKQRFSSQWWGILKAIKQGAVLFQCDEKQLRNISKSMKICLEIIS